VFCQYCGTQLDDAVQFCTSCGRARVGSAPATAIRTPAQKLNNHLKILGVLWIVYSLFGILMGMWSLVAGQYILPMMTQSIPPSPEMNLAPFLFFMRAVYAFSFFFSLILGTVGLVAAWAFIQRKPWGRMAGLIAAFACLISIPFGTALAIYTLVVLLPGDAAQNYRQIAAPAAA